MAARPFKPRCVAYIPGVTVFKPAGVPAKYLTQVTVHLDELEALRLVNIEGLDQEQAAQQMGVSRPTVGRMLKEARRKITQALVNGEALLLEHGKAPINHKESRGRRRKSASEEQRSH